MNLLQSELFDFILDIHEPGMAGREMHRYYCVPASLAGSIENTKKCRAIDLNQLKIKSQERQLKVKFSLK